MSCGKTRVALIPILIRYQPARQRYQESPERAEIRLLARLSARLHDVLLGRQPFFLVIWLPDWLCQALRLLTFH